ncbi:septum formation initiator family protein [Alicyclobacillus acidiphilus]|uniref:septum formation initiator family protein n=1 Tax=Alicyclobacillus acidiphilus TaxID=182455 RepID=UPI00082CCBA5|nr:septum formation initiator family protein [Alicyclobacillus acidiphilus]
MAAVQEQIRATRAGALAKAPQIRERQHGRPETKQSKVGVWANGISLAVCCLLAFAAVWMVASKGAEVYALNQKNVQLQTEIQQQQAINATLSTQVDELKQPSRILEEANKLGMQYKTPIEIPSTHAE